MTNFFPSDILLKHPKVGNTFTVMREGLHANSNNVTGNCIVYLGAGKSGIVRKIWFACSLAWLIPVPTWEDLKDWRLRVYTDQGDLLVDDEYDTVTPPPDTDPDVDISLASILGAYFRGWPGDEHIEANLHETVTLTWNQEHCIGITLNVPIPFDDGILIQLGKMIDGVFCPNYVPLIYQWSIIDKGRLPDTISSFVWPYKTWRLKSGSWDGATSVGNSAVFLREYSGGGQAIMLFFAGKNDEGNASFAEENWTFDTGNPTAKWEVSGTEDIFGVRNIFYFLLGKYNGRLFGLMHKDTTVGNAEVEAYKYFTDDSLWWKDGCFGYLPCIGTPITEGHITCLYYQDVG